MNYHRIDPEGERCSMAHPDGDCCYRCLDCGAWVRPNEVRTGECKYVPKGRFIRLDCGPTFRVLPDCKGLMVETMRDGPLFRFMGMIDEEGYEVWSEIPQDFLLIGGE